VRLWGGRILAAAAVPAAGAKTWTATPAAAALPAAASIAHQPGREGAAALGRAACGCAALGPITLGLSALGRVAPGWAGLGGSSTTRAAPSTNHQRVPRGRIWPSSASMARPQSSRSAGIRAVTAARHR